MTISGISASPTTRTRASVIGRLKRGGPALRTNTITQGRISMSSDSRKLVRVDANVGAVRDQAADAMTVLVDGAVTVPFDASGLVEITQALLDEGFSEPDVALIMGGNVLRLLSETLPR